jgi:cephalosporin-C deacetylase-like acetyl esterase
MDADADCNSFATERMMIERRDMEFELEGGDRLRGWLFVPETRSGRHPAISMAHAYATPAVRPDRVAASSHSPGADCIDMMRM